MTIKNLNASKKLDEEIELSKQELDKKKRKLKKETGLRLYKLRTGRGLRLTRLSSELCAASNIMISEKELRRYENGETAIPVHYAIEICKFFDVSLDYLYIG